MAQQRTQVQRRPQAQARRRTQARQERQRDRSPALAAGLSALAVFGVAILIFVIELNTPGTTLRNWWLLVTVNGIFNPGNEMFQQWTVDIERQDALFAFPFSLLIGGLVLGRLAPRRIERSRLLRVSATVSSALVVLCVGFRWALILWGRHGHLAAGDIDSRLVAVQTLCVLAWVAAYVLGTLAGLVWRDSGRAVRVCVPPA